MAKLKAATRNATPASKLKMVKKGKLSPAMASRIRKKANAVLGSGGSSAGAAY